ncbi:5134_t:CDS:2, partial [Paraglomus occultum]
VVQDSPADIILGMNFMYKYNAVVDMKGRQFALQNDQTGQLVIVPLEMGGPIYYNPAGVNKGPKSYTCIQGFMPENDVQPCEKCKDKADENDRFESVRSSFIREKKAVHANSWKKDSDAVDRAYELYLKGAQLKPNSQAVKGNITLGELGDDWTQYHPEWRPTKVK